MKMETKKLNCWEEFEEHCQELRTPSEHELARFLFRGQENASWRLETTLEREWGKQYSLKEYYRIIHEMHSEVESATDIRWSLPTFKELFDQVERIDQYHCEESYRIPAIEYMVYLRHHGYPSPLLDWSVSPYVAAYFVFRGKPTNCDNVAIFAYSEMPYGEKNKSNHPSIYSLDRSIITHRRHFLQQSKYTICFGIERIRSSDDSEPETEITISPHESVFDRGEARQDLLYKFILPSNECSKVLRHLNKYNLNAFSLFGSEDALMETLANRRTFQD
jgi:hypothetical protein